jgi:hypothetical protein
MDTTYDEKVITGLKTRAGKEFSDMSDEDFTRLVQKESKENLEMILNYLKSSRDFYKRVLLEEYRKKHPNSFRYKDADEQIARHNTKGKLLKSIIDKK